jgi:hypothetical protein
MREIKMHKKPVIPFLNLLVALAMVFAALAAVFQPAGATGDGIVLVDRVWEDLNIDGIQDLGEPDFPEVTVNLYTCAGELVGSTATNTSGNAAFFDLLPGDYFVEFVKPAGFSFSPQDQGLDDEKDSDADLVTGRTVCFYLAAGLTKKWDAGLYRPQVLPASLGDFVWYDENQNGVQDADELGVEGMTVRLLDCAGNLLAETWTDENGYYLFSNLMPGNYNVQFVLPAGYAFTLQDVGDDAFDSDADAFGNTICTTLESGEHDMTWDAGIYMPPEAPGTGTPGYWKNHPEAWPVDVIVIGDIGYTKEEAIYWMSKSDKLDKTITLFRALVAAKLNIWVGNDDSCIIDTVNAADAWMAVHPVGSKVKASSNAWKYAEPLYWLLDDYNNGLLWCAVSRG